MSINSLMADDIIIIHPTFTTDSRNNSVPNWTNTSQFTTKGWMAQTNASASNTELTPSREGTLTEWRLFLPYTVAIDNRCRIRYGSDTYEIVGAPHLAKTPLGPHHKEVPLRLVVG